MNNLSKGNLHSKCKNCGKEFNYYRGHSKGIFCCHKCAETDIDEIKRVKSLNVGRIRSLASRVKQSESTIGKKKSIRHRKNIRKGLAKYWIKRGGGKKILRKERDRRETRDTAEQVKIRDGNKCVLCGSSYNLEAHHLIQFSFLLRETHLVGFGQVNDKGNIITLCNVCHSKTPSYMRRGVEHKLMDTLQDIWEQKGSKESFEIYYMNRMDQIIEHLKSKLND